MTYLHLSLCTYLHRRIENNRYLCDKSYHYQHLWDKSHKFYYNTPPSCVIFLTQNFRETLFLPYFSFTNPIIILQDPATKSCRHTVRCQVDSTTFFTTYSPNVRQIGRLNFLKNMYVDIIDVVIRVTGWLLSRSGLAVVHASVQDEVHLLIFVGAFAAWTGTPPYLDKYENNEH